MAGNISRPGCRAGRNDGGIAPGRAPCRGSNARHRAILRLAVGPPGPATHRAEIAQLVEHATENRGVASSNLALGTKPDVSGPVSAAPSGSGSVGRASPCQGEGRGFESRLPLHFFAFSRKDPR